MAADTVLDLHHKTYEHHGDELEHLDDLEFLCRDCHAYRHGKSGFDPLNPLKTFDEEVAKFLRS